MGSPEQQGREAGRPGAVPLPSPAAQNRTHVVAALLVAAEVRLGELHLAMRRVDRGTYGRCEGCGRPIADVRLDALPTTTTCVACAS